MRKYYLFAIKKDVYQAYYSYPKVLYQTLNNLYHIKRINFSYGISIYEQICDTFNTEILDSYFIPRKNFKIYKKGKKVYVYNLENNEKYIIEIRNSCLIILCQNNLPNIMKLLDYYNSRIFVADFDYYDYFWNNTSYNHKPEFCAI